MRIPVILGTAREGRESEKVARYVLKLVDAAGHSTELIDARDYRLPATDNSEESETAKRFIAEIVKADALLIVSPEYNHGYPGELKMLLDMAFGQYKGKPVLVAGVSSGHFGGARMIENLHPVLLALGLKPVQKHLYFPNVADLMSDDGPKDRERYDKLCGDALKQLAT